MAPHFHAAQVAQVLAWMEQADASQGSRKPVLAAGRDGVFVPIRGDDSYREAATATLSVHDRAGQRLGTVYLGRMPEPGQGTLSEQLTRLITDVLARWSGPLPRLAYVTDAGHHQTEYYERVLKPMRHPSRPGEPLEWEWVIDYYHASEYVHKLSQALFRDPRRAQSWAWKMCRWLKTKPRAIYRILHSAAAIRSRRLVLGQSKAYREAYGYLRDHIKHLDYVSYRRNHLPIGSGVTEAACKTVFSQRLKRSGMAWSVEGGQRIVDLRVIDLSGVWSEVHQSYLQSKRLPEERTQEGIGEKARKSRIIPGIGAIAPLTGRYAGTATAAIGERGERACPDLRPDLQGEVLRRGPRCGSGDGLGWQCRRPARVGCGQGRCRRRRRRHRGLRERIPKWVPGRRSLLAGSRRSSPTRLAIPRPHSRLPCG